MMFLKLNTFICHGFICPDCGYSGQIDLQTPAFVKDKQEKTFRVGDKVTDTVVGKVDYVEGFFCPTCLQKGKPVIRGVILVFEDGVFKGCIFD